MLKNKTNYIDKFSETSLHPIRRSHQLAKVSPMGKLLPANQQADLAWDERTFPVVEAVSFEEEILLDITSLICYTLVAIENRKPRNEKVNPK